MTLSRQRLRASRIPLLLVGWSCVSAMAAGCSSGVKTVTVDCPLGGAAASAGKAAMASAGSQPAGGSAGAAGEAGEAGASGIEAGGAQGGMSLGGGGSAGVSGGASGGHAGNTSGGGHGGVGGSSASGGSSGSKAAVCGDKVVTSPEFCDDGTNTDLSYGCYACTTLPPATAPQGAQQCDACLNQTPTKDCFACQDHRACYACLRRQPSSFADTDPTDTNCSGPNDDDVVGDPDSHRQLSDECFNPNDPNGSAQIGGRAGTATRASVCQALVACALRTGCASGTNPVTKFPRTAYDGCYCGDGRDCSASSTQAAAGPCVEEVLDALALPSGLTAATAAGLVGRAFLDSDIGTVMVPNPSFILGVANRFLLCADDGCASACYPSGTGGSGGVGGSSGTAGGSGGVGGTAGHSGSP